MIFAQPGSCSISTILGSCVSVCLWDPVMRVGGMNHFLLPFWNGEGLKTPKFGNVAIPMLIDKMVSLGCYEENIKAKVIGGASVIESASGLLNIGERNISLAEGALEERRIPVLSRDTGGTSGRKVLFITDSGDVYVKKVSSTRPGNKGA